MLPTAPCRLFRGGLDSPTQVHRPDLLAWHAISVRAGGSSGVTSLGMLWEMKITTETKKSVRNCISAQTGCGRAVAFAIQHFFASFLWTQWIHCSLQLTQVALARERLDPRIVNTSILRTATKTNVMSLQRYGILPCSRALFLFWQLRKMTARLHYQRPGLRFTTFEWLLIWKEGATQRRKRLVSDIAIFSWRLFFFHSESASLFRHHAELRPIILPSLRFRNHTRAFWSRPGLPLTLNTRSSRCLRTTAYKSLPPKCNSLFTRAESSVPALSPVIRLVALRICSTAVRISVSVTVWFFLLQPSEVGRRSFSVVQYISTTSI